jgi:hypothetical protein
MGLDPEMETRSETQWCLLRPEDQPFLPGEPLGAPFCYSDDIETARRVAANRFTPDVLEDCTLARRTVIYGGWEKVE